MDAGPAFSGRPYAELQTMRSRVPGWLTVQELLRTEVRTSELTPGGPEIQGCSEPLGVRLQLQKAVGLT